MTRLYGCFICLFIGNILTAQSGSTFTLEEVVNATVEDNFGLRAKSIDIEMAANNYTKGNAGYTPDLSISGGADLDFNQSSLKRTDNSPFPDQDFEAYLTNRIYAGINASYVLYQGGLKETQYETFGEYLNLENILYQQDVENTLLNSLNIYYTVAQLQEQQYVWEELLAIDKERVTRAEARYEFATGRKLDVLNAQVNLQKDSAQWLNIRRLTDVSKLNLLLNTNQKRDLLFNVETLEDEISTFDKEALLEEVKEQNSILIAQRQGIVLSELEVSTVRSRFSPVVSLNAGYNASNAQNSFSQIQNSFNGALGTGVTVNYTLFDGGRRNIALENAKLSVDKEALRLEELEVLVESNFETAWLQYEYEKQILSLEQKTLAAAQLNYERSIASYDAGQISSTQLREAQLNLYQTKSNIITARYNVKLAELELFRLAGRIVQ